MNTTYHKVIAFLLGAVLGALVPVRCSPEAAQQAARTEVRHRRIDTVRVPVTMPSIETGVRIVRRNVLVPYHDSTAVLALIAQRDALQDSLRARGAAVIWSGDTIVMPNRDTVTVECDEINRRASIAVRYSPRSVAIERITDSTVITIPRMPRSTIAVGAGGVIGLDGTLRPGAFIGVAFNLFPLAY